MTPLLGWAAAATIIMLATACGGGSSEPMARPSDGPGNTPRVVSAEGEAEVRIKDFDFLPPNLEVAAGQTVTWTNEDFFGHTVTSGTPEVPTEAFDGVLGETAGAEGQTFSYTFEEPGTVAYFCRFHPKMLGTVEVSR